MLRIENSKESVMNRINSLPKQRTDDKAGRVKVATSAHKKNHMSLKAGQKKTHRKSGSKKALLT